MRKLGLNTIITITLALLLSIPVLIPVPTASAATSKLSGTIIDESTSGIITQSELTVFHRRHNRYWSNRWDKHSSAITDNQGKYTLELEIGGSYLILVTHTNNDREYDYIPYGFYYNPTEDHEFKNIELWSASLIQFEGLDYFVETTAIPETTFKVKDQNTNEVINYGNLNLVYGPGTGSISSFLNIPRNKIYVPSGRNFWVEIQSYVNYNGENIHSTLNVDINRTLIMGEKIKFDLRSIVLPQGIAKLENKTESIESLILDKENEGFFLAVERHQLSEIKQNIISAISLLEQNHYSEAFTKSREIFLMISDLENGIDNMLDDAIRSVYALVLFIALTAAIVASLLFEDNIRKVVVSIIVFIILIIALYNLHPGTQVTTLKNLTWISIVSLLSVNAVVILSSKFLNKASSKNDISLLNMTIPILSIAKRSLRRRKIRFVLTLTCVLLLVASFISLTSFKSGYGLSFTKISNTVMKEGIMVRSPDPPIERAAAPFCGGQGASGPLPLKESLLQWYNQMEEITCLAPRYENYPQRQYREAYNPVARIGRTPIFGIVGIDPMLESQINKLDSAIVDGRYLSDEPDEALISVDLAKILDVSVGETLALTSQERTITLNIVGLFDDESLSKLTDLDGYSILPNKIIEAERVEADGPDFVVEALAPCNPDEVIWINLANRVNISSLWLMRLNIVLNDEADILEFTRSTALNRGFRVWGSTLSGVYLAELTDYFEGKGLPIVIPWVIVVLNVVVTMMNAYYERRHEVMIYSSIGMNPRQISGIFLAEAAVIGALGGCVGYILGLGAYKIIFLLTPALQVHQKVSAIWSIAAIGISIMAVIVGGLSALKNSTAITPSLKRHWTIDKKQESKDTTRIVIPIQVYEDEIHEYIDFIKMRLEQSKSLNSMVVRMPKMNQTGEKSWEYTFVYCSYNSQISPLYTRNRLVVEKGKGSYNTILYTMGTLDSIRQAGSFLRQVGLDWSIKRVGGVEIMGTSLKSVKGFDVV